ncbi:DUF6732 family protein [Jannaschia sp. LMIT008]|uniref:DUF6732 family protein n=1 Tax=Jannaschia maritima TaxID=3032585 RepID=UPI002811E575|nr:DUF6732 family protein [Jannaschia sp. LMIT008]
MSIAYHLGHIEQAAGHDHWVAGAVIGAALAAGIWGWLKKDDDAPEEPEGEPHAEGDAEDQPA